MELKKPLDAEVIFKKLYKQEPKDKYEISYGEALLAQYKFEEVLYDIKLSALSDTLKSKKYILHASAYFGLKKKKTALKFINQAVSLDPNNPDTITLMSLLVY
jgi:predicted Zn-dependent protease